MPTTIIRQGDLHLMQIEHDPIDTPAERVTLAVGENSGHAHVIEFARVSGDVLVVEEPTRLVVDPPSMSWRHEAIEIAPGAYRYWIQREYTPEAIRQVVD